DRLSRARGHGLSASRARPRQRLSGLAGRVRRPHALGGGGQRRGRRRAHRHGGGAARGGPALPPPPRPPPGPSGPRCPPPPPGGVVVIAAVVLFHPAHLPTVVAFTLLAALARPEGRPRRVRHAVAALILAAGCTAFWTLPLVARLASTRALAWGTLSMPSVPFTLVLVLFALVALRMARTPSEWALARGPWIAGAIVPLDRLALGPPGRPCRPAAP